MSLANFPPVLNKNKDWFSKAITACIGAGAAVSVVFWGLQLSTPHAPPMIAAGISLAGSPQDVGASVARALGHTVPSITQETQTGSQFKLLGVISSASGQGSALIAMDDQLPKAYRVGQTLQEGLTLESVSAKQAMLKSSGRHVQLDLPDMDKP